MQTTTKERLKKFLFIPAVLLGVAAMVIAVKGRQGPVQEPLRETVTKVRIIEAPEVTLIPRALGYGNVEPGTVWEAVAEVGGEVTYVHPNLKRGAIVGKGEELIRIDPTRYRLALKQIEANVRSVQKQLAELTVRETNTAASLRIEERVLTLRRNDLKRKRELLARRNASQAAVDQEERNVLDGRQAVQSLKNTLNLIPAERETLKAQLALYNAQAASARLDLRRTVIRAPFDARISAINVQVTQYAAQNKVLAAADSIGVAEITAQVPVGKMFDLVPAGGRIPDGTRNLMAKLPDILGLSAIVRLRVDRRIVEWRARFARINDTIDPATRTVGVIVAVDEPYKKAVLGVRPPLTKNMFVEVELRGKPRPHQIVVPRAALHGDKVYVADSENRLQFRHVAVAFFQTNFAVIKSGLDAGERVVISDVIPAVQGMLLAPTVDGVAAKALVREAEGKGGVR